MLSIKQYSITTGRDLLLNITAEVNKSIADSGIKNGVVVVECPHSTAGILKVDVHGEEVLDDIVREMRRIIPARINFYHQEAPENAAGHIKSSLFGSSVSLILKDGKLLCDGKQDIYFADYDGPRERVYSVLVMGEE